MDGSVVIVRADQLSRGERWFLCKAKYARGCRSLLGSSQ